MPPSRFLTTVLAAALAFASPVGPLSADEAEWDTASPADVDISPDMIAGLVRAVEQGHYGRIKSLLILRHGRLVHEQYFDGHGPDELMPLYSVSKSWGSALVGALIDDGYLAGVEVGIDQVFRDYGDLFAAQPEKRQIRFRDLLTMRHGLAWDEWSTSFTDPGNPVNQMTRSDDWWRYVLSRPLTAPPDSVFRYSTGVSNLVGGAIWSLTGKTAEDYSAERLFGPLGIEDWYFEVDLAGLPRGTGIRDFQAGLTPTGHGLWLRARDMAKIGQLYLDRGAWKAHRILASAWVEQTFGAYSGAATDPGVFPENVSYGLQWWTYRFPGANGEVEVHAAVGFAGQYIFVIPELDVVVVSTADNGQFDGQNMAHAVRDRIIPGTDADFDPVSDGGLTGSWFNPELRHQGFMLEVVPTTGQVIIYWMTFEPGSGRQQWMIAVGQLHGRRAVLEFLRPEDGTFVGGGAATLQSWGDAELLFLDCTRAKLAFFSDVAGVQGAFELQRLTPNTYCDDD